MTLLLSSEQLHQIQRHAERVYPEECCGILLGQWQRQQERRVVRLVWKTLNAWNEAIAQAMAEADLDRMAVGGPDGTGKTDRTSRYWIDPADLFAAQRHARSHDLEIIGIYHSHPDHPAIPSESDRRLAWPDYSYLILSIQVQGMKDYQSWSLDEQHQFRSEAIGVERILGDAIP